MASDGQVKLSAWGNLTLHRPATPVEKEYLENDIQKVLELTPSERNSPTMAKKVRLSTSTIFEKLTAIKDAGGSTVDCFKACPFLNHVSLC